MACKFSSLTPSIMTCDRSDVGSDNDSRDALNRDAVALERVALKKVRTLSVDPIRE